MRTYPCFLMFFLSSMLCAMEQEDLKTFPIEGGLTIEETCQMWQQFAAEKEWGDLRCILKKTLAAAMFTVVIPGAAPGVVMSFIGCFSYFMRGDDAEICIPGLSFLAVPVLAWLSVVTAYPVVNWQRQKILNRNNCLKQRISKFAKKQKLTASLTEDQIRQFSHMIFSADSAYLKKLNVVQALALAKFDVQKCMKILDHFEGDTWLCLNKLKLMYETTAGELAKDIKNNGAQEFFNSLPGFLDTLITILPVQTREEESVNKALVEALVLVLGNHNLRYENPDNIFKEIVDGRCSLQAIILQEIDILDLVTDQNNLDNWVEIKTFRGIEKVNKKNLSKVSDFFSSLFTDIGEGKLDLTKLDIPEKWHVLLIDLASGKPLVLAPDNVMWVIDAAKYFQMYWAIKRCDNFLAKDERWTKLILPHLKNSIKPKPQSMWDYLLIADKAEIPCHSEVSSEADFNILWKFSDTNKLIKVKSELIKDLSFQLNQINRDDETILKKMKLLSKNEIVFLMENIKKDDLEEKLHDAKFFKLIWQQEIPFLKDILLDFSIKLPEQKLKKLIDRAWAFPPAPLLEAINNRREEES